MSMDISDVPRLDCFRILHTGGDHVPAPKLVAAPSTREWMDATHHHFANRCTPLTIANASGWELLNPVSFTVTWNGYSKTADVSFHLNEAGKKLNFVSSIFGHGIVTFHPGYLFRTDPGWMMSVRGSPNRFKDGIHPLDGLVETSWLPFNFTMNWRFTRPCSVNFKKGEPFCFITLTPSLVIESVQPVIRSIAEEPDLADENMTWRQSRQAFNQALKDNDDVALKEKWQKFYLKGVSPTGNIVAGADHRVKRALKPPLDMLSSEAEANKSE